MQRIHHLSVEPHISVRDQLELKCALQQKGIAMHIANLLSFKKHEERIKLYFDEMNREEVPQHCLTSMDQVRSADKEVFLRTAGETRRGFSASGDLFQDLPVLPLDGLLEQTVNHPRVLGFYFLSLVLCHRRT